MRLLLDTHTFLWYYAGNSDLSPQAKSYIENPNNDFFVSSANLWEISIKHSIGKLDLNKSFEEFCRDTVEKGFDFLTIDMAHIIKSNTLAFFHKDPFDRLLIAQVITEKMNIISKDEIFDKYLENEERIRIW